MASDLEVEVKFYLRSGAMLERQLINLGAVLVQPRVLETNLRYDTPVKDLGRMKQALRLRQDQEARLTFKGPRQSRDDYSVRQEIEFTVSNFETAQRFLSALGYQPYVCYEKFRTTYELDDLRITVDQLPFGDFTEVEGREPDGIQTAAKKLGLKWENRVIEGYLTLFARVQDKRNLRFNDLTFANFSGLLISPDDLGLRQAD